MWSAWWILWALTCQIHVVAGKQTPSSQGLQHEQLWDQAQGNAFLSKLNSSDSQVSRQVSFYYLYRRGSLLPCSRMLCPVQAKWVGLQM
jgi:hypothetical protein